MPNLGYIQPGVRAEVKDGMADTNFDVLIVGSGPGPGGYIAVIRAAQLGFKAAIVQRPRAEMLAAFKAPIENP